MAILIMALLRINKRWGNSILDLKESIVGIIIKRFIKKELNKS